MRNAPEPIHWELQLREIVVGTARFKDARANNQRNNYAPSRGAFPDIEGAIAEGVFAQFMAHHYPDKKLENVGTMILGTEGIYHPDYRLNGHPIDIKGTRIPLKIGSDYPHLLVPETSLKAKAEYLFVLVADVGTLTPVVIGWIKGTELLKKGVRSKRLDDHYGFGQPTVGLPHHQLHDFRK